MAHQSRDWRRTESSRNYGRGQPYRNFEQDERGYRRGSERWDEDEFAPKSAEGVGDYGGYSEEERSYRGDYSPARDESSSRYSRGSGQSDWREQGSEESYGRYPEPGSSRQYRDYVGSGGYRSRNSESGSSDYGRGTEGYGRGRESGETWGGSRYLSDSRQGSYREGQRDYQGSRYQGSRYGSGGYTGSDYGSSWERQGQGSGYQGSRYGSGGYTGSDYGSSWERQGQGSHRGKGPKGYERSDDRLKEIICERLSDDPDIDASEITVTVSGGVVKLTGTVESRADKYQVEELIERCGGVKDIDNQLRAQSSQSPGSTSTGAAGSGSGSYASGSTGSMASSFDTTSGSTRRSEGSETRTSATGTTSPGKKQ
jgi:osmotically-inducible protein OsmY